MGELPRLPLERDGTLPPIALLLRWLAALPAGQTELEVIDLPHLNGCLPSVLALGGVAQLTVRHPLPVPCFIWEGLGGGRLLVNHQTGADQPPLHQGALPSAAWPPVEPSSDSQTLNERARQEDAQALLGSDPLPGDGFGVWNPLPFARRGMVALAAPAGQTAPALIHPATGASYPVQLVERELLVELPLAALEAQSLQPRSDPVPGAAWEVNAKTLDNGLVRAELDLHGQIERLCFAGRFVELAGALVHPLLNGVPLGGHPAEIRVLEHGPVRARLAVSRETAHGVLQTTYTLQAHEPLLRVAVVWPGAAETELLLDHPTLLRHGELRVAGELASETRRQTPSVLHQPLPPARGCRWAVLGDGHGGGLALLAPRPITVTAVAGHLRLACTGRLDYLLGDPGIIDVAQAALSCAVPLRTYQGRNDAASPLRLSGGTGVAPLWIRSTDGANELLLAEQLTRRNRVWLFPRIRPSEAWRSDARGQRLGSLPITAEGDGIQIDLHPGELALVRWR